MISKNDVHNKNIALVNGLDHKTLKIVSYNIQVEDTKTHEVTGRFPANTVLAVFVIGNMSITTPTLESLNKRGVPLLVMKPNLRPVFTQCKAAEGNFLLRQMQHTLYHTLNIAQVIIQNKILNQANLLNGIRSKSPQEKRAVQKLKTYASNCESVLDSDQLMGLEGRAAKLFFENYYREFNWKKRMPRAKIDPINALLDIGYTILFNFIEALVGLFGFDPYVGVFHKLWFNRKSLVCDLVEPFRCIIDRQIRKSLNLNEFKPADFELKQGMYRLKYGKNTHYTNLFFSSVIKYKLEIFLYIQSYYRCFMGRKSVPNYPKFEL